MRAKTSAACIVSLFLMSCALNRAVTLNDRANQRLGLGDPEGARQLYSESLEAAQQSGDKDTAAIAMYGLGRANGFLCHFREAEQWLKKSIVMREQIPDSETARFSQNLFELARLYYDFKEYASAISYFERVIPMVEESGATNQDPIGYANVLEDYADALQKENRHAEAEAVSKKISGLRDSNPGVPARFHIKRFTRNCPSRAIDKQASP